MVTYSVFKDAVENTLARLNEAAYPQDHDWEIEDAYDHGLTVGQCVNGILEDHRSFAEYVQQQQVRWMDW